MVDVGEETGELDTMLYKVADTYDEEVAVLTESLISLMEPLLIIVLGRGGRFHRHRAVHAAGGVDFELERRRRKINDPRKTRNLASPPSLTLRVGICTLTRSVSEGGGK